MNNLLRCGAAFLCLSLFSGCANQPATTPMLNKVCLVSGESLPADAPTADYMGGKIGFCCDKCVTKWNGMDDNGKKAAFDAKK